MRHLAHLVVLGRALLFSLLVWLTWAWLWCWIVPEVQDWACCRGRERQKNALERASSM